MNLTCRELCGLLMDFLDGTMAPELRTQFEQHLCACPPCRTYLDTYKQTIRMTRMLPREPLPTELVARLQVLLEKEMRCQKIPKPEDTKPSDEPPKLDPECRGNRQHPPHSGDSPPT
ncbi:anti-sigma factor family protein [Tuwongella immobilis]|uniref:Putative zinc-finger domain-containing protein n=1 Tax=Tuwongella immobilis TaxID=692036 RepID=A0A6C2YW58_9BACT|nr:zf-HC2 domain-containing protein [Tuwongella immobilis]VIP05746.1 Uncharacterized protein OS=Candidatus Entotheonella sp. TSY2 GN=ETSY2_46885 PE=4 SV=1: zf-HC2 [Tuwongella immobilis]VTS08848.1 Uncharacterized protein OS=Candidatus Entotheonella sp. TSY2 GN=ETSY2_46885 PE=4 SV=1: zf-HC2 [Tuwongella immobilis]